MAEEHKVWKRSEIIKHELVAKQLVKLTICVIQMNAFSLLEFDCKH